jgi:hypothetical protein
MFEHDRFRVRVNASPKGTPPAISNAIALFRFSVTYARQTRAFLSSADEKRQPRMTMRILEIETDGRIVCPQYQANIQVGLFS